MRKFCLEVNGKFVEMASRESTIRGYAAEYAKKYKDAQVVIWNMETGEYTEIQ